MPPFWGPMALWTPVTAQAIPSCVDRGKEFHTRGGIYKSWAAASGRSYADDVGGAVGEL